MRQTIRSIVPAMLSILLLGPLFAGSAAHAEIIYLTRASNAQVTHCDFSTGCAIAAQATSTSFDDFNQRVELDRYNFAAQNSVLSATGITATLNASKMFIDYAISALTVTFALDTAMLFSFVGMSSNYYDGGRTNISLVGPGTNLVAQLVSSGGSANNYGINTSGILQAGQYTLSVLAEANSSRYNPGSYASVNLALSPVPLPAAAWLLIGALGGLGALTARRRR